MKKENVRIKENITMTDKINVINRIVDSNFTDGKYTPYFEDMAKTIAIVKYFIEGVYFDKEDDIYACIINDEDIYSLVKVLCSDEDLMEFIYSNVYKKVEFMKHQIIHSNPDMDKIIEFADIVIDALDNFAKLDLSIMTPENVQMGLKVAKKIADSNIDLTKDSIVDIIKESVGFDLEHATAGILDSKNEQIRNLKKQNEELKKYKTLWDARNVTSDKSDKVVPIQ